MWWVRKWSNEVFFFRSVSSLPDTGIPSVMKLMGAAWILHNSKNKTEKSKWLHYIKYCSRLEINLLYISVPIFSHIKACAHSFHITSTQWFYSKVYSKLRVFLINCQYINILAAMSQFMLYTLQKINFIFTIKECPKRFVHFYWILCWVPCL